VVKRSVVITVIIVFISSLTACNKQSQYIEAVDLTNDLYIINTDTVKPEFKVYRVDSFQTSATGASIIGAVKDPAFGYISSQSFARFNIAGNYYETVGSATESFDSIVLIMRGDHRYYGDTTSSWSVNVHQLKQDVDGANINYYNQHTLLAATNELGSSSVKFRPHVDDSVRIRLAGDFGSAIFKLYKDRDSRIISETNFLQYFKGLRISPSDNNKVIYSFGSADSSMYIRLYYHDDQGRLVPKYLDFKSTGGRYQFNNIIYDASGSALESLTPGNEISSNELGHVLYVNDLAGIGTKVTFPSVSQLALIDNFVRLGRAQLDVKPIAGSTIGYPLIDYISLGITNAESGVITPLYSADASYIQLGDLYVDLLNGTNTGYQYDLTALLTAEINSNVYTANTVYLQPYNGSGSRTFSLNRLVAADGAQSLQPSTVQCQMLFYKK
jgi:hypothetical protein